MAQDLDAIATRSSKSPPQTHVADPQPDQTLLDAATAVAGLGKAPDDQIVVPRPTLPASFEELVVYAQNAGADDAIISQDLIAETCAMLASMTGLDGLTQQQQRQICAKQGGQRHD